MPTPDPMQTLSFAKPDELEKWLETNHSSKTELWIKMYKKGATTPSVTWDDVVIAALCWGWIDGIKKSLDDQSYLQRITPRKPGSNWSKRNKAHVEKLLEQGRMQPSGLVHVNAAKADGRWDQAYTSSEMAVPEDFITALNSHAQAKEFYESLAKSHRYVIALGLTSAKKAETRQRRFDQYLQMLINGEKPR